MLFFSGQFLLFLAVTALACLLARSVRARVWVLLVASYVFYAAWDWRFLGLIALSTAVDYAAGLALSRTDAPGRRRACLAASVIVNLGVLGFFKYFGFFVESATALLAPLGVTASDRALGIVHPVGISYYTFQSMSNTIDVYRRQIDATPRIVDFALFVSFFPQLVAGPIVRAKSMLPQLQRRPRLDAVDFRAAFTLFLVGFVKKSCIADGVAPSVDALFADPTSFTVLSVWTGVLLYAVQIYCDFSGYTDMAIASARLLGYELTPNFRFPYFARNINEFWRRWHMSLSSWLRDYLYVGVGGMRGSHWVAQRSLMITMLLAGLWHGAAWNFVAWGALNGVAMVVHREWRRAVGPIVRDVPARRALSIAATFLFVCTGLIVFRAPDFEVAGVVARAFLTFQSSGAESIDARWLLLFAIVSLVHGLASRGVTARSVEALPDWAFALAFGAAAALALAFVPMRSEPFIYFQF